MEKQLIDATVRLWESEPDKAIGTPTVKATTDGAHANVQAGPFTWTMDLPAPLGGTNQGPSPTLLMLGALAGCAAVFIRDTLAPQLNVQVDSVEATATCRADSRGLLAMDGVEPDLRDIDLQIDIRSTDDRERVQELYDVWKERCPIYLALIKPMNVNTSLVQTLEGSRVQGSSVQGF